MHDMPALVQRRGRDESAAWKAQAFGEGVLGCGAAVARHVGKELDVGWPIGGREEADGWQMRDRCVTDA